MDIANRVVFVFHVLTIAKIAWIRQDALNAKLLFIYLTLIASLYVLQALLHLLILNKLHFVSLVLLFARLALALLHFVQVAVMGLISSPVLQIKLAFTHVPRAL